MSQFGQSGVLELTRDAMANIASVQDPEEYREDWKIELEKLDVQEKRASDPYKFLPGREQWRSKGVATKYGTAWATQAEELLRQLRSKKLETNKLSSEQQDLLKIYFEFLTFDIRRAAYERFSERISYEKEVWNFRLFLLDSGAADGSAALVRAQKNVYLRWTRFEEALKQLEDKQKVLEAAAEAYPALAARTWGSIQHLINDFLD